MYICDLETGHHISGPFELGAGQIVAVQQRRRAEIQELYRAVIHQRDGVIRQYQHLAAIRKRFATSEQQLQEQAISECIHEANDSGEIYAYFSPDGKHVLVQYLNCAVVWDIDRGKKQLEFNAYKTAFICHGRYHGRIVSTLRSQTKVRVELRDAGSGVLMLFEVSDADVTRFSPDGRFLAVGKRSGNVIELWNVEDGKNVQQFSYPPGNLSSLRFSPTSDSFVAFFAVLTAFVFGGWTHERWHLSTSKLGRFLKLLYIYPPLIAYSSREITQWRCGRSQ